MTDLQLTSSIKTVANAYRGKRILVTGSSGYLANNLIHMLKNVECQITRVARTGKILTWVNGLCEVEDVIGNLCEPNLWPPVLANIDIVFHFAGQANIQEANTYPVSDIQSSVLPFLILLDTCRQQRFHPHIVLASSVSLYGFPKQQPVDESFANQPQTIYDLHKLHSEDYLHYFIAQNHVSGCSLRLSNVYGPGIQNGQYYQGLINHAINCALNHTPIPLQGDGKCLRDYLYLDDATHAFLAAGCTPEKVNHQRYIVASGQSYSTREVLDKIQQQLKAERGITATITHTPSSLANTRFSTHPIRFQNATDWLPQVSLDEGIRLTIAGY